METHLHRELLPSISYLIQQRVDFQTLSQTPPVHLLYVSRDSLKEEQHRSFRIKRRPVMRDNVVGKIVKGDGLSIEAHIYDCMTLCIESMVSPAFKKKPPSMRKWVSYPPTGQNETYMNLSK
jgi:hypothetical protein